MYVNAQALLSLIAGILILISSRLVELHHCHLSHYRRRPGLGQMIFRNIKTAYTLTHNLDSCESVD